MYLSRALISALTLSVLGLNSSLSLTDADKKQQKVAEIDIHKQYQKPLSNITMLTPWSGSSETRQVPKINEEKSQIQQQQAAQLVAPSTNQKPIQLLFPKRSSTITKRISVNQQHRRVINGDALLTNSGRISDNTNYHKSLVDGASRNEATLLSYRNVDSNQVYNDEDANFNTIDKEKTCEVKNVGRVFTEAGLDVDYIYQKAEAYRIIVQLTNEDNKFFDDGRATDIKRILTQSYTTLRDHSSPSNIIFGSTLVATAIPLVALLLPSDSAVLQTRKSLGGASLTKRVSLQSRIDSMMGWIERSVQDLPSFPRLHPQECFKRTICEAHNQPTRFGALGFMLRVFFPATITNETDSTDDMDYKVINKYKHAASYGRSARLASNGTNIIACKDRYEDCLVSLLEVMQGVMDVFLKK